MNPDPNTDPNPNPNPATVSLPQTIDVFGTATSSGSNFHRVTLLQNGEPTAVFSSTGEGSTMKLADGSSEIVYQKGRKEPGDITLQFEFSTQGSDGPFTLAYSAQVISETHILDVFLRVASNDVAGHDGYDSDNGAVVVFNWNFG